MLDIKKIVCGAYAENAYIVNGDILIDPGDGLEAILAVVSKPRAILLTHGHFDHMLAAEEIQKRFGTPVYVHPADGPMLSDEKTSAYLRQDASMPMPTSIEWQPYGETAFGFKVLHTPGHTEGSVCLYAEEEGVLFSGDTLFQAGFGRTDLAGGSSTAMRRSLRQLLALPRETRVLPGHAGETTIGIECGRYGR